MSLVLTKYFETKKNKYTYSEITSHDHNYEFSDKFSYTGAVNFYEANAQFQNCKFMRIDSEDALNIISSKFLIENSFFEENSSDSIDVDFGEGVIKNSKFAFVGNDAIDLSGSQAYLENLHFFDVGDKLISSGENTEVKIKKINGEKSYIGIASKDGSKTIAENINFLDVKIPFASYQKKKSFEYGTLKINDPIYLENYVVKNIKDKKSTLYINEEKIQNFNQQAFNIVYKKKLSLIYEN